MLVGVAAVVAVAAAAAVAVVVLRGRGDDGLAGVDTPAEARKLAARVALTPSDWGVGFQPSTPYETGEEPPSVADAHCTFVGSPDDDVLARLERDSERRSPGVIAQSAVTVYRNDGSAQADIARTRSDTQRCRTETDGKARWEDVHEVEMATPDGLDEVTAEEGRLVVSDTGESLDQPYTQITGRKDRIVLQAVVNGAPAENRSAAVKALSEMLNRI
ncbi:hypothetical protein [Streptomyces griseosporeus]|uniref:hypothetical protein n=1 Tax=Streptomyces griseosporeus TaxID=1910 RepID=UPI0036FF93C8